MAQTFYDTEQKRLIKRFHTLLGKAKIDNNGKADILASYYATSTKELSCEELLDACNKLHNLVNSDAAKKDKLRKRLMAAIGGYLRAMNIQHDARMIIAMACRAAKAEHFNDIPTERLNSLYNAFVKRQKDLIAVDELTVLEKIKQVNLN